MTAVLQVREQAIAPEQIVPLLKKYQLMPQLIREVLIDQAITPFPCSLEQQESALKAFYASNQIRSEAEFQTWLTQHQMSREKLIAHLDRALSIEKFKYTTWGHRLESYFLQRKAHLDRVIFSMVSTQNWDVAQELYFRLQEGEQTFAELASVYSQGAESQTQGIVGPIAVGNLHPVLQRLANISQVGQLWAPIPVDQYFAIVRLEKRISAQLDDAMRQTLLQELFANWLQEQLNAVQSEDSTRLMAS